LVLPYFALLALLGVVLESIGHLISRTIQAVLYLVFLWVLPGVRSGFRALSSGPIRLADRMMTSVHRNYPRLIQWALDHRAAVLGMFCLCGLVTWQAAKQLETELLPEIHQGEFTLELSLPVGTPLEKTRQVLQPVEERILADLDDIQSLLVTYGFEATNLKRSDEGVHSARFKVLLKPGGNPAKTEETVIRRLRGYFQDIPDLEMRVVRPVLFSTRTPIVVEIQGDDLVALRRSSQEAERVLSVLPELADVEASLRPGAPEVQVSYQRDLLSRFGLNISTVARQVRDRINGYEASRFNLKDRRIPILVRLQDEDRDHVGEIEQLTVNPGGDDPIPLESVADLEVGEGPSEVRRVDGQRVALVEANLGTGSLGGAVEQIAQRLRNAMNWPADVTFTITGQNQEWDRSRASLMVALGLSLFLVYVIMAAQFESLLQPLIILLTIPLAFFGTVLGLLGLNFNLSIVVFLGMIMLVGIVVNNAIVLVDYINTLQRRGMNRTEAIRTAGNVRIRPILMTTATTVLGLLPMALGWGEGAEIRTPMAVAVIGGLITSTLLTLVVIPTCYDLVDRGKTRWFPVPSRDS
jgi:HAE1 family hydrophobic/amphiphilic exporter-1